MCEPRNFLRPCVIQGYPSVSCCLSFRLISSVEDVKPTLYLELPCAYTHRLQVTHRIVVLFILFIIQYQVRCPRVVQLLADMAVVLDGESLVSKVPLEMPVSN